MKLTDPREIVLKPVVTEKASGMRTADNIYQFYVHPEANRRDIKKSVERLFSVDVVSVRVIRIYGKPRRRGMYIGKTAIKKKAIVKLKEGQTIPIFEGLV